MASIPLTYQDEVQKLRRFCLDHGLDLDKAKRKKETGLVGKYCATVNNPFLMYK